MAATELGAKPRRVECGGRLVQKVDGLIREVTGMGVKLAAEPEQSKSDTLDM